MNIEYFGRKAIKHLKTFPNFPDKGFIAGGSIANLIWEYVSGTKAIINDIDVFVFDKIVERNPRKPNWNPSDPPQRFIYDKKELQYYEDYRGMTSNVTSKEYYMIEKTEYDNIYNTIYYSGNTKNPSIIINSFDINCTQVGYSIEEDLFYWTKDFEYFINTGELMLVNLQSPAHSAIRIVKKQEELKAKLDYFELELCSHTLNMRFADINRMYFTEKYAKIYEKYGDILSKYFNIMANHNVSKHLKDVKNVDLKIFELSSKSHTTFDLGITKETNPIFLEDELRSVYTGQKLLFYIRHVRNNPELKEVWKELHYIFENREYMDITPDKEDILLLNRLCQNAPNSINHLNGLKISEQISIVRTLLKKFDYDPIIAISILENKTIDPNLLFDDSDLLLLELSVRKEILNDTKGKVNKVLGLPNISEPKYTEDLFDFL